MRSFFSTPLFRLLAVIVNCSLLFPILSFGFSPTIIRYHSKRYIDPTNPMSLKMWSAQVEYWKKLGISLDEGNEQNTRLGEKSKEQESNKNYKTIDSQKNEILADNQPIVNKINNNEKNTVTPNQSVQTESGSAPDSNSITLSQNQNNNLSVQKTGKEKQINRKNYSAVKNLPDAEKLRTTSAQTPKIPAPILSTACLISTINCPSDKNREIPTFSNQPSSNKKSESLLSSLLRSTSSNIYSWENLLAKNDNSQNSLSNTSLIEINQSQSSSDVFRNSDLFKNMELYGSTSFGSYSAATNSGALLLPPGGNGKIFDFDGDNKADIGVWRPDTGAWYVLRSSDGTIAVQANFGLGSLGDRIVPANYDNDTKTDYAYWQPSTGVWTIKQSSNNQTVTHTLGQSGDIPVQGDYDGDGKSDPAVYRPSNGTWYYRKSSDGTTQSQQWGNSTDVPVIGDFDGDNKTDFTVVRPADTTWRILQSSDGDDKIEWGMVGDRLVPGDYDGDNKTDVAVWRASDNTWYIRKSTTGLLQTYSWDLAADIPVPADYDNDGKTDYAVWNSSSGTWHIIRSGNSSYYLANLGLSTDIPIPSSYVRYFSAANQNPTAEAGGPYTAVVNTAVRLDGRASTDSDGQVYGYNWNFGDGTTGTGSRPSHIYSSFGTYTVSLTVTDNQGAVSSTDTATVAVIDATDARLDPFNSVGGDNVISRNFSWGTGLAGLPGRAGMGAGLSLSYNSLVWLKRNSAMIFDPDNGFPGPGFRLGMPVIEKRHYNWQTFKNGYLMITENGSRVEFRQVGASNIYETADSSYTQLIDYGNSLLIRTTDGTQHSYQMIGGEYQCVQVKDSNGNFITAAYNSFNRLAQITDTSGHTIVVNYDENGNPISVAQSYGSGQQRIYATFGYESKTINTSFSGMTVIGPANNSQITVLKQVAFDDGSYYRFNYNSYGQIYQIDTHAADTHKLNHVKYNLESPGTQTDCPRFTQRENYAENWMTVTTSVSPPISASWTMPDTYQIESGLASMVTTPDGTINNYYYHSTGWDKAIPMFSETRVPNGTFQIQQRWVTTRLTQNNTGVSYIDNPRVTSSAVGDDGSVRKSGVSYTTFTLPSGTVMYLPNDSIEYNSDGTTVYRHAQTDYNFNAEYVNRYIIGLPSETRLYAGVGTGSLQGKTSFGYDEETLTNQPNIIQHDTANYGTAFGWRGNLTSARRWNVVNTSESTVNRIGYNIAGTPAWTQDPVQTTSNRVSVSYADNFSDGINNRNTYAYPTTVTDPEGYTATSKYHFLTGLVDEVQGPRAGQTSNSMRGAISKTYYDTIDRMQKTETLNSNGTPTGAYTRYEYPISMTEFETYTKLDGSLAEAYSLTVLDGHGRTRATASELPSSSGGFSGRTFLYDNLGRNWKSSFPAETSASGNPSGWTTTGDDAASGWLYTTETFDWKGRSLVKTNTDGTTKEALYVGCGCAGGNTVVTRDEVGRRQKMTYDLFGRSFKSQILQNQPKTETINGGGNPYSTTVNSYNVLDQVINSKTYDGNSTSDYSCPTGTCQESTVEYDGFNRTWRTHAPQQDANTYETITYRADDKVQNVTDARGAQQSFTYNYRKLLTQVEYPTISGISQAPTVTYQYDSLGNRTQMSDGLGSATYSYDELSRVISETRTITQVGQTYQRDYTYFGAGLLTGITDPSDSSLNVTYSYDKTGRLTQVGDSAGVSSIVSGVQYRAFGGTKQINYGNTLTTTVAYNNRLQTSRYELRNSSSQILMGKTYQYTTTTSSNDNDGLLRFSEDLSNNKLNRRYGYDHVGRMATAKAGNTITTSGPANGYTDGPFEQAYSYNVFGSQISQSHRTWTNFPFCQNCPSTQYYGEIHINNRNTASGWQYDADGRVKRTEVPGIVTQFTYDSAGRLRLIDAPDKDTGLDYDGDGKRIKQTENGLTKNYFVYFSMTSEPALDLTTFGNIERSYIYSASGQKLAKKENGQTTWLHSDVASQSNREANSFGVETSRTDIDPLGNITSDSSTYNYSGTTTYNVGGPVGFYNGQQSNGYCGTRYGVAMPCILVTEFGIGQQSIQQMLANHPWSLANMWTNTANSRLNDSNTSGRERLMWGNIRDSEQFWQNLANGFITIPEYTTRGREIINTGSRRHWVPNFLHEPERSSSPQECPKFTLKINSKAGQAISKNNPLKRIASKELGARSLGPLISTSYGWLVEIIGTTSDLRSGFRISQTASSYNVSTDYYGKVKGPFRRNNVYDEIGIDVYWLTKQVGNAVYTLDAPGLARLFDIKKSGHFVGNFTTTISGLGSYSVCKKSITWAVEVVVEDDKIPKAMFYDHHVPLP